MNLKIYNIKSLRKEKGHKKIKSLKERFKEYEKIPDAQKGSVEPYDWGKDGGKEIIK